MKAVLLTWWLNNFHEVVWVTSELFNIVANEHELQFEMMELQLWHCVRRLSGKTRVGMKPVEQVRHRSNI